MVNRIYYLMAVWLRDPSLYWLLTGGCSETAHSSLTTWPFLQAVHNVVIGFFQESWTVFLSGVLRWSHITKCKCNHERDISSPFSFSIAYRQVTDYTSFKERGPHKGITHSESPDNASDTRILNQIIFRFSPSSIILWLLREY